MKEYVIIVAGGKGLRMGNEIPKQFLEIGGKAIILHTLKKFSQALPQAELILVLPKGELDRWNRLSKATHYSKIRVVNGGNNRFESVKSGLDLIQSKGFVAIHDAVRPFVSIDTINRVFDTARNLGAAIPVIELKDSLRVVNGESSNSVNRSDFRLVQTPQCFSIEALKNAYNQAYTSSFTDDASVVEAFGGKINLVEGNAENIKITTKKDLKLASFLLG